MKVTLKAGVVADPDSLKFDWCAPFRLSTYADEKGANFIKWVEVETDIPDSFDMRSAAVKELEQQERTVLAEAQAKATDIRRRINELLAITNEVSS